MKTLLLGFTIVMLAVAIPSSFDRRVQPQIAKYSSFGWKSEGICAGYSWAKELAQIVGNVVGLFEQQKLSLSAQQILECTESQNDICSRADLEDIHAAIAKIQLQGITTSDCYPNRPFAFPSKFCRRECSDGSRFIFNYFPIFTRLSSFDDVVALFKKSDQMVVFAVLKVDDAFNYYSPFGGSLITGGPKSIFEYRVAELVGWKDGQSSTKVILRAGPGEQWGFDGYMQLELSKFSGYIQEYYKVQISDEVNLKVQQQ